MDNKYEIKSCFLGKKRQEYLTNDAALMATAIVWAGRSKDPSTQVGACYANEKGRIISVGYNGSPNNWNDDEFPWGKEKGEEEYGAKNTKYPYVIHAEMNGILNYEGSSLDFKDSTCYVTLFPCSNCAKFLAQRGIKRIVYMSDKYVNTEDNVCAKILLDKCGVEYVQFDELGIDKISGVELFLESEKAEDPINIKKLEYKKTEN